MQGLNRFVDWMRGHQFIDRNKKLPAGLRLNYHSRSDEHSKQLGRLIIQDLLDACDLLREHAARGDIAYSINYKYRRPDGKPKTLDLAVGIPAFPLEPPLDGRIHPLERQRRRSSAAPPPVFKHVLIACEEKAVMTEHIKSQPRVYSELNDSHTIVHHGNRNTIAAGITMINIATTFISPLRQRPSEPIEITPHTQPRVAELMVRHLRGLPTRQTTDEVGFEAYCSFVVDVDNQGRVELWTEPPAPQPGDTDHYDSFLRQICDRYSERFVNLSDLRESDGLSVEDALTSLAEKHPGLIEAAVQYAVDRNIDGASELQAILQFVVDQTKPDSSE